MSAKSNYVCDGCGAEGEFEAKRWLSPKLNDGWGMVDVELQKDDDSEDLVYDLCPACYPVIRKQVELAMVALRLGLDFDKLVEVDLDELP